MVNPSPPSPAPPGSPVEMKYPTEWYRDILYYVFQILHPPNQAYSKELPHDTMVDVIVPEERNKVHMRSFLFTAPSSGLVEVFRQSTETSSVMIKAQFLDKSSIPFCCDSDVELDINEKITARFIADAPIPGLNGFITIIAHEHASE